MGGDNWVQIRSKTSLPPQKLSFSTVYLFTLSLFAVLATTIITVSFSATISTTGSQHSHRPATTTVGPLPLQIFFFFFLPAAATISRHRQPPPLAPAEPPRHSQASTAGQSPSASLSSSSSSVVSTVHVECEKWRVIHCSFLFFFFNLKFQKNLSKFFL